MKKKTLIERLSSLFIVPIVSTHAFRLFGNLVLLFLSISIHLFVFFFFSSGVPSLVIFSGHRITIGVVNLLLSEGDCVRERCLLLLESCYCKDLGGLLRLKGGWVLGVTLCTKDRDPWVQGVVVT